jgi:hypothetical protein
MKRIQITVIILICIFVANGTVAQTSEYVPVGSSETETFEKGLYGLLPVYVCGIYPKADKMKASVSWKNIPLKYTKKMGAWVNRVLKPELTPEQSDKSNWAGIRKIRWNQNYLVGRFVSSGKKGSLYKNASVEFQADDRSISLTITSDSLFPQDANDMSDTQILGSVIKVLNIPEDKTSKIDIEKHLCTVAGINVCYGKMRCEWNEKEPNDSEREWWSYVPFWYIKGKVFVHISTIEWKEGERPASATSTLEF